MALDTTTCYGALQIVVLLLL